MFRQIVMSVFMASVLVCEPSLAQTDPMPAPAGNAEQGPAPEQPGDAAAPTGAPPRAMARRHAARVLIAQCRSEAKHHGLVGRARRHAVLACVRTKRPDVAVRMVCRAQGRRHGISSGPAMRAYVRKCKAKHGH